MLAAQRLTGSFTLVYPLLRRKTVQRTSSKPRCPEGNIQSCSLFLVSFNQTSHLPLSPGEEGVWVIARPPQAVAVRVQQPPVPAGPERVACWE